MTEPRHTRILTFPLIAGHKSLELYLNVGLPSSSTRPVSNSINGCIRRVRSMLLE